MMVQKAVKRLFDIVFSAISLTCLSPILFLIAISIKVDSPGEVVFKQSRVGRNGKLFTLYKFRSMTSNSATKGHITQSDSRITKVGHILRKTSLDELPQLVNIFKGEMSLIGPRPTLQYQVEQYTEEQKRRLNVRPGLTGYAQVNGRNQLRWPEKIALDVYYVDHWSLWLDVKIFFKTFKVLVKPEQVFSNGSFEDSFKIKKNG